MQKVTCKNLFDIAREPIRGESSEVTGRASGPRVTEGEAVTARLSWCVANALGGVVKYSQNHLFGGETVEGMEFSALWSLLGTRPAFAD
jgi:hypothetical protein